MLIICPNCSANYEVKTEAIGDKGRSVRCARCRKEWFATAPLIETMEVATPAGSGLAPPIVATVADHPAPPPDPPDGQVDWDMPAPDSIQAAPVAGDENLTEESIAVQWDVPQSPSPPLAPDSATIDVDAGTVDADTGRINADSSPSPVEPETWAARRMRRTRSQRPRRIKLPRAKVLIALQLALICAGLLWRNEIVHLMPQTASFFRAIGLGVNVRGLAFADLRISRDAHDGITVLIIDGDIVNTTHSTVSVPRLRLALRNTGLAELISWTTPPDKGILGPGETLPFRSRLVSPPAGGSDILVRFLNRHDLVNGVR